MRHLRPWRPVMRPVATLGRSLAALLAALWFASHSPSTLVVRRHACPKMAVYLLSRFLPVRASPLLRWKRAKSWRMKLLVLFYWLSVIGYHLCSF